MRKCKDVALLITLFTIVLCLHSSNFSNLNGFLTRCLAVDPNERASAAELLQTAFIKDAIAAGTFEVGDPKLEALAKQLSSTHTAATTAKLECLAPIVLQEW
jgi:serine/threonine protein kinase